MVWISKTHHCDKCSSTHSSYEAAEKCEVGHIIKDATDGFAADLDNIFESHDKRKGKP